MRPIKILWFVAVALALFTAAFGILTLPASAQEVIMNQPSADVVARGQLFVRGDSFYTQSPAFFEQNLNTAYGLFNNFEVSLNDVDVNHTHTQNVLVPGFKWAPLKKEWSVCGQPHSKATFSQPVTDCIIRKFEFYVGDQYWKPIANRILYHNGNVSYEAFAYTTGSWRFTAGSFQSHNAYSLGNRAGAIGGIEYMHMFKNGWGIGPGIDYASGAGINGYTSPGLMFSKGNFFLCPGYMIANPHNPNGAHQSFVMIGYTFARRK